VLSNITRWSGLASILGAVLLVVRIALPSALGEAQGTANPYEIYSLPLYVFYNLLLDAALLLFVVGLVGLHARQAKRFRQLGRTGLFLAVISTALLIVSAFAALMVGLWPGLYAPLVLFTQLLAGFCLILGLVPLGITGMRMATLQEDLKRPFHWSHWISDVRWRGALLILGASLGAAYASHAVEWLVTQEFLGLTGAHWLHVLLTIPVAAWVAHKISAAPVLSGVTVGLVSGVANQVYFHALQGTLSYREVTAILTLSAMAGFLGGIIARYTAADQETLYRASRAITTRRVTGRRSSTLSDSTCPTGR
jgi:hypothetical protein